MAGPLPGRLLRCLHTMRAGDGHVPSARPTTGATPLGLAWTLVSTWSGQACRTRAAELAHLVGYTDIAGALRDEVDREARAVEHLRAEVVARLVEDPDLQTRTRAVLAERWEPVRAGEDASDADDVEHLLATLFGAPRGRAAAAAVDRDIEALPGLDGLGLMVGALDRRACADRWVADVLDLRTAASRRSPVTV